MGSASGYGILAGSINGITSNPTRFSVFNNNTITGGYAGIRILGDSINPAARNQILNNGITNFSTDGISLQHTFGTLIERNDISRPLLSGTFHGILLERGNTRSSLNANRIHDTHDVNSSSVSQATGVYLSNCDAAIGSENIVKNNLFYNFNNTGEKIAVNNIGSNGAYYYHNTIHFQSQAASTSKSEAFNQSQTATNIKFINNIINLNIAGGFKQYAYYFASPASQIETHHNVIYLDPATTGTSFTGFANGTDYATLTQWQTAPTGPYDTNSLAANPMFANSANGNLRPTNASIKHSGIPLADAQEDFDGVTRSTTNPDPRAYEFSINTGVPEKNAMDLAVKAFPNPFCNELTLELNAAKPGHLQLTLRDAIGRTVCRRTEKVAVGTQTVKPDLDAALPGGFYILEIELNGQKTQQKLIKR